VERIATHYDRLGVSPTATASELRAAYYRRARELHPDTVGSGGPARPRPPAGGVDMAAVNEAWRVLSDPGRRALYDASLRRMPVLPAASAPAAFRPAFDDPDDDHDVEFVPAPMWKHRLPFWAMLSLGAMALIFVFTAYAGSAGGPPTTRVKAVDGMLAVGSCARLVSGGLTEEVDCGAAHEGVVAALIDYDGRCPPGTSGYRRHDGVVGYACLRRE
jgi:hypothetical protein